MSFPYRCPACGTNRTRFNIIEQVVHSVKKDRLTGEIIETVPEDDPFQIRYRGEKYRVQCGVCGMIDKEERFVKFAQNALDPAN